MENIGRAILLIMSYNTLEFMKMSYFKGREACYDITGHPEGLMFLGL